MPARATTALIAGVVVLLAALLIGVWGGPAPEDPHADGPAARPGPAAEGTPADEDPTQDAQRDGDESRGGKQGQTGDGGGGGGDTTLTLAFAGDVHFEGRLAGLLDEPKATLGPMTPHLRKADLAMVNLESALTSGGSPTTKELEDPSLRYWFRSPPRVLDLLDRSGVDVVTIANNHGGDYGRAGLKETLEVAQDAPVAVVGVGAGAAEAFAPYRTTVKGTDIAVLAADAAFRESERPIWAAGEDGGPAIASARKDPPKRLAAAVEEAAASADVVVVYLHWGESGEQCPTGQQATLAKSLAAAGADIVVGSHAHVLLGAGMLEDTYVSYGLGNFVWYNSSTHSTGVLKLRVADGRVVSHRLVPGRIPDGGGRPRPVGGSDRAEARERWANFRDCTDLEPVPDIGQAKGGSGGGDRSTDGGESAGDSEELPAYEAQIQEIGASLRERMSQSHDPGTCPVEWADLRHLTMSYVDFDGRRRNGEMVVHADHAEDVVGVFEELYDARWPIRRMRLIDEYGADDDRSMAADNTSAYNCRRVAGTDRWSKHAYGAAVDINPVENPYVTGGEVRPPDGREYAEVDRSADADTEPGVIKEGDVVTQAFERIGWTWGATFSQPDYQHFAAP